MAFNNLNFKSTHFLFRRIISHRKTFFKFQTNMSSRIVFDHSLRTQSWSSSSYGANMYANMHEQVQICFDRYEKNEN